MRFKGSLINALAILKLNCYKQNYRHPENLGSPSNNMADSKDEAVLDAIDQEKAIGTSDLEENDADPSLEKVAPPSGPAPVTDGGKIWIVAFGGFSCLYASQISQI
jgi:hypothetical protein